MTTVESLIALLKLAQPEFCARRCKYTGDRDNRVATITHSVECERLRAAINGGPETPPAFHAMMDLNEPAALTISIDASGRKMWINDANQCRLRAQDIGKLVIDDRREQHCPSCDAERAPQNKRIIVGYEFQYGIAPNHVMLKTDLPVYTCSACELEYTNWEAEDAQQAAIDEHLGRKP